jgi:lipoprotein-releasing system permease protein
MSWFRRVNIEIAFTHLWAKKQESLIALLGVTFGIAMFIVMISLMNGVNLYMNDLLLATTANVRIFNTVESQRPSVLSSIFNADSNLVVVHHQKPKESLLRLKNGLQIAQRLRADPQVKALSASVATQAFFNYGPAQVNGQLYGVHIPDEQQLFDLSDKVVSGQWRNLLTNKNGAFLGVGLADKLNAQLGDLVTVATPTGATVRLRVEGIFRMGIGAVDNIKCYVNTNTVQQLLGQDNQYITEINLNLHDIKASQNKAKAIQRKYGLFAEDWETANASLTQSFLIRNMMTLIVSFTMLLVAGFGIYNIMSMSIVNKMKEIAILKAQGFSGSDILQIFLSQSLTIGLLGGLLGLLLGYLLAYSVGQVPLSQNPYVDMRRLPIDYDSRYYIFGLLFGVLTTLVAGIIPALKAARLDPVAILRG